MKRANDNGIMMGLDEHGKLRYVQPLSPSEYENNEIVWASWTEIARRFDGVTQGKIVSVLFTKEDGTLRLMTGRKGVTRYLKGGVKTDVNPMHRNLFCFRRKGYRNFALDRVVSMKIGGKRYIKR
jgi:hypothetical protein